MTKRRDNVVMMFAPSPERPTDEAVMEGYQELGANLALVHNAGYGRFVVQGVDRYNQIAMILADGATTLSELFDALLAADDD